MEFKTIGQTIEGIGMGWTKNPTYLYKLQISDGREIALVGNQLVDELKTIPKYSHISITLIGINKCKGRPKYKFEIAYDVSFIPKKLKRK